MCQFQYDCSPNGSNRPCLVSELPYPPLPPLAGSKAMNPSMDPLMAGKSKSTILLFTIALAIIFALLFYKGDRLKDLLYIVKPDRISVLYLKLLLNINPDNTDLHLELARHYINLGQEDQARFELEPLLEEEGSVALEAKILILEIDFKNYFSLAEDDPRRATELARLQSSIIEISKNPIPVTLISNIINLSLELNQPAVAANLFYQWSTIILEPAERIEKLKASGQWYIAAGLPSRAAEIYHTCYELSENTAQARQFALLALQISRAAGGSNRATEYFHVYQQRFPKDPELLDEMISIYFADHKPKYAYELGVLRLALDPDNPDQINKQIEHALAAEEIQSALVLAQRLIGIVPNDHSAHERLAHIAEWNDKPALALKEWLWLARNRKDEVAIKNTLRLSKELYFFNFTIEMLEQLALTRELADDEVNSLLHAYNAAGNLSDQIKFFRSYVKRYPNNSKAWEALAKTQENAGQIAQAMTTWQYIGAHFDRLPEAVAHQAKLLWKIGQSEKSLAILLLNQDKATEKDSYYWEILGELSWVLELPEHSFSAYSILWKTENADVLVAERLIQIMRDKGKAEEAIAIGEQAYDRFNESRWLLLSMDVANQAGMSTELKRLVNIAMSNESKFHDSEMYWLLRAQLEIHEHKPDMAIKHYQHALTVNPASITAKEGILWSLIEQQDRSSLQSYLKKWHTDASENSLLWGVYGIALTQVGQYKEALPWLERKAQISPDDYLWQLSYADVLNRAGYADKAWHLRKYVLFNLRSHLNEVGSEQEEIKDLLHPEYLALVRDMEGANAEVSILKNFLAKGYDDPAAQELLVAAYLTQENYLAARQWLLQEHIARQETPAWQRLTLALAEKDLVAVEHILENEGDKLAEINKMEAYRRLNRNEEALALTYDLLDPDKGQTSALQSYLFTTRDELAVKTSKQIIGGFDYKSLGDIDFIEGQTRFTTPYLRGLLGVELKYTHLNSSDSDIILPVDSEVDIAAEFKHPLREGMLQLNVGGNLRDDKSLAYGSAKVSQDITNSVRTSLRVGVNETSYETGPLRALGRKDIVLLNLSTQLTQQTVINFDIDGHRYLTREGNTLGKGYKLQGILGNSLLSTGVQEWQIRLQGSWESNDLEGTLPSELAGFFSAPVAEVETLITKRFGTMGAGTTLRYGPSDAGVLRRPFLLADAWVGWVWPNDVLGYNGRVAMGISILGPDILSAGAFYSNIQGGKTDQAFTGVGLQYSIRF